ncbi:N-acetylmuramoyl-L-alanine amidase [Methylophaga sulfidovorans]|uniref:N-acetylmuramoyl-L-alanine amidase AmiC n=1 Tax=Methylophaga sulfidovorans TaxID=45496 RepID=A0A1I4AXQ2_9GAMM|nr:N-acetylmuramoyl-L-alanine amidase [Methylophaga sulfidovorans]SFK61073.1 N-acetylmuramoyl-L-alanine amidase [Methylophaga sulfidovorans]
MVRLLLSFFLICFTAPTWADSIQGLRVSSDNQSARLVFDLDNKVSYKAFTLANPDRLVIDLKDFQQRDKLTIPSLINTPIKAVRYAAYDQHTLRIVLDLAHEVQYQVQSLPPQKEYPNRLVVDLSYTKAQLKQSIAAVKDEALNKPAATVTNKVEQQQKVIKTNKILPRRDIIIAIDPGHGGQDSGAIGAHGTKEKDVVLAIAKRLAKLVDKEPGMRSYLTRNSDVFISLRQRIRRARENGADMFISIHADAFTNRNARGSSVYVLSSRGASSEAAQILADRENAADLAGGISLEDKDDLLASVLLDLSQTASLEGSLEVGQTVLSGLKRVGHVHKKHVESAAFVVLKSPDIPSILVETAFISNPEEERKLKNGSHQNKLAHAMMVGIRNYFQKNSLPGTNLPQQHIVSRGDTLSMIAQRYQVKMADIKSANNLASSEIQIGDVLKIP